MTATVRPRRRRRRPGGPPPRLRSPCRRRCGARRSAARNCGASPRYSISAGTSANPKPTSGSPSTSARPEITVTIAPAAPSAAVVDNTKRTANRVRCRPRWRLRDRCSPADAGPRLQPAISATVVAVSAIRKTSPLPPGPSTLAVTTLCTKASTRTPARPPASRPSSGPARRCPCRSPPAGRRRCPQSREPAAASRSPRHDSPGAACRGAQPAPRPEGRPASARHPAPADPRPRRHHAPLTAGAGARDAGVPSRCRPGPPARSTDFDRRRGRPKRRMAYAGGASTTCTSNPAASNVARRVAGVKYVRWAMWK